MDANQREYTLRRITPIPVPTTTTNTGTQFFHLHTTEEVKVEKVNDSPNHSQAKITKLPGLQDFTQLFECPVCYDITVPPINTCLNGHNICYSCRKNVVCCPVCRMEFGECRNIFAEQMLEKCTIMCKYAEAGCKEIIDGNKATTHQFYCEFRPVQCPDCDKHIEYHKFLEHLEAEVQVLIGPDIQTGYDVTESSEAEVLTDTNCTRHPQSWEPTWIQAHGKNFFALMESDQSNWWFSVAVFSSIAEAANFHCQIIMWNKEKGMHMEYCGPVHSLRASTREAHRRGECLMASKSAIAAYTRKGGVDLIIRLRQGAYKPLESLGLELFTDLSIAPPPEFTTNSEGGGSSVARARGIRLSGSPRSSISNSSLVWVGEDLEEEHVQQSSGNGDLANTSAPANNNHERLTERIQRVVTSAPNSPEAPRVPLIPASPLRIDLITFHQMENHVNEGGQQENNGAPLTIPLSTLLREVSGGEAARGRNRRSRRQSSFL